MKKITTSVLLLIPFLFLDECTSSLNGSLRELCTKIIRKYLQGTTVIVICHETVEGDYDTTVQLSPSA